MSNLLNPNLMSPAERQAELVSLLAMGAIRLFGPKSSDKPAEQRDFLLDFDATQSGAVAKSTAAGEPEK
jgi:hypothetical protein